MECSEGCILRETCNSQTDLLFTTMAAGFLAFLGFIGGQFCYIVSLRNKISDYETSIFDETPPSYQSTQVDI